MPDLHNDASRPSQAEQNIQQAMVNSQTKDTRQARVQQTKQLLSQETRNMSAKEEAAYRAKMLKMLGELHNTEKNKLKEEEKSLKQQLQAARKTGDKVTEAKLNTLIEQNKAAQQENTANAKAQANAIQNKVTGAMAAIVGGLSKLSSAMTAHFDKVIQNNNQYRSSINTRLQGLQTAGVKWMATADKWGELQYKITKQFGTSMLINEQDILKNINTAVEAGIANNIEQRAILATLSEDVANTFEAFSGELLRYIRISQRDNTALMLGMESSLTTMLNSWFQDTSYLKDIGTSAITGVLTEAMSQMDTASASEFNFAVQKWLSSLYASGMSSSGVQAIAQAIGQAYSGDVTAVGGQMQNLLAMAASRSGQSYADILKDGINGSNVNTLMKTMVGYLAEIANNSANNVVRTAFGNVFGMSVSDLKAAQNLMTNLEAVTGQSTTVNTMLGQASSMIGSIGERLGLAGMVENLKNNFLYTTAANLVNNPIAQIIYSTIKDFTGLIDFSLPTVGVLGNYISFEGTKLSDIINAGIGGLSIISGIGTLVNGLMSGNTLSIAESLWNTWGSSGTGFAGISGGAGRSLVYTGGAASDIAGSEYTEASSNATKTMGYDEGAARASDKNVDDVWTELSELRKNMFGDNRKAILVDINPDTLPVLPVDVQQITFGAGIGNFVTGNVAP